MTNRHAYTLLLLVILSFSGNFPLGKIALRDLGPLTITAARMLVAVPLLLLVSRLSPPLSRRFARQDYIAFVVLGLSGVVGNTTMWYWGLAHTTALNAGILGAAAPIFVAVGAAVILDDRLEMRNYAGIALTVAAVLVTVAKGSLHVLLTFSVNRGDLIILVSQIAWVTYALYSRAATTSLPPLTIMTGAYVVSGIVLVPLAVAVEWPWASPRAAPAAWLVVLYCATAITAGHLWFYRVIRAIGAGRASTFMNLMPFVVIALSWALLGERIHAYHLIGAAMVIAGVWLASR